jgi:hypothetical protein
VIWRTLRFGLAAGGAELVLLAGAAYLTWEHDQGGHDQAHMLCPICWMDKVVPVSGPAAGASVATSAEPAAGSPAA